MILVTGGCRSGKSAYGEKLTEAMGARKLYIATGQIFDEEMSRRVENHRLRRGPLWITHEGYRNLENIDYKDYSGILLDSVTSMVTNLLFDRIGTDRMDFASVDYDAAEKEILSVFRRLMNRVSGEKLPLVMVTDEVGLGVVPGNPSWTGLSGHSRTGQSVSGRRGAGGLSGCQRNSCEDKAGRRVRRENLWTH